MGAKTEKIWVDFAFFHPKKRFILGKNLSFLGRLGEAQQQKIDSQLVIHPKPECLKTLIFMWPKQQKHLVSGLLFLLPNTKRGFTNTPFGLYQIGNLDKKKKRKKKLLCRDPGMSDLRDKQSITCFGQTITTLRKIIQLNLPDDVKGWVLFLCFLGGPKNSQKTHLKTKFLGLCVCVCKIHLLPEKKGHATSLRHRDPSILWPDRPAPYQIDFGSRGRVLGGKRGMVILGLFGTTCQKYLLSIWSKNIATAPINWLMGSFA